ncbi:serine hydrolase [[Muricauda] lutisoli]|uniref:Serine hydrolase n=1 Tax=[Muricauda] lutisoli TaxID=2816035 RepID=A0ABS3F0B3_9FLAO|nr:serine hydrolase [[Muricauda] lutisoli]MBO0331839.1 serine hydrolase [[Muricauda] lutisoli]
MRSILLIAVVSTLLFSCGNNKNTLSDNSGFNKSKLDSLLNLLHENDKFMGSVSLSKKGNTIYSKAYGFDDIETQKKSTVDSKYRIGSISKMLTATLVFKAIEENKLNLKQTIDQYFPDIENANKITIANLLNHRSGIHSFTKDTAYFAYRTDYKSSDEMLEIITNYQSDFEPGTKAEYSNSNFFLLSVMLESVYEKPFGDLLIEKICAPLDLKDTYYGSKIDLANNESNSYTYSTEWIKEIETDLSTAMGAGGMVSTSGDLTRFLEGLFDLKIVSQKSLEAMTTIKDNHGMGILPFNVENKSGFGHGGIIEGFKSYAIYFPEDSLAIALTSNAIDYNFAGLVRDVAKCYFGEPFSLPNFNAVEISPDELEKYEGIYTGTGGGKFTVTQKDGVLHSQLNDSPANPLVYKGKHKFFMEENGAEFIFNPETGQMSLIQIGVANAYIFTKE